jgi:hypothetical protein
LADIQAQQVEVGRIRLGTSTPKTSRGGKSYNEPVKLERFRLTSKSQQLIDEAAALYGGEPEPWEAQNQWQVIIEAVSLPVVVPPNPCSQFYEQWTGGRCQRRCDGIRELLEDVPCPCGPDPAGKKARGCKPTTRLSLMLADMNGIGLWRLETHGFYAAAELPAVADLLSAAGGNIPARLEMEERQAEVPDPRNAGKTVISKFMVPVLHVEATPAAIIGTFGSRQALEAGPTRAALPAAEPAAAADEEPDQEVLEEQWKLYNYYQGWIDKAETREQMTLLREKIETDSRLTSEFLANISLLWSDRAKALAGQAQSEPAGPAPAPTAAPAAPSTPSGTAPPPPSSTPATSDQPDRTQVWNEIMQLAGAKQLSMSTLKTEYGEWGEGGPELTRSTGAQLAGFKLFLEGRHR